MKTQIIGLSVMLALGSASAQAMNSCSEVAEAAHAAGESALGSADYATATREFQTAADACDLAVHWQALGESFQQGFVATGDELLSQSALDAYGKAFASARRAQDDTSGATAARSIVDLGLLNNDPLKAQNWLLVAGQLDADHPDMPELQARLDASRAELSASEIDTGLSQTRGLGKVNALLGGDVTANAFWEAPTDEEGEPLGTAGGGSAESAADESRSSIDIPIRFASNSTEMTGDTAANVSNLAKVLAGRPDSTRIILTGHADVRGDADYNLRLSRDRAAVIKQALIDLEPSLFGRIDALGDGESRPVDAGMTEQAHANNRRLEVTLVE